MKEIASEAHGLAEEPIDWSAPLQSVEPGPAGGDAIIGATAETLVYRNSRLIVGYDLSNHNIRWKKPITNSDRTFMLSGRLVCCSNGKGDFVEWNPNNGKELWTARVPVLSSIDRLFYDQAGDRWIVISHSESREGRHPNSRIRICVPHASRPKAAVCVEWSIAKHFTDPVMFVVGKAPFGVFIDGDRLSLSGFGNETIWRALIHLPRE
jgi:hypothetical protein